MIVQDGQEICIEGIWYRGGDMLPGYVDPNTPQIIDNNDVKNIDTETVDDVPQKRGRK
jgi:hypothetical protein